MKKRFSEEQIIGFLREAETGLPVKELCRQHGFRRFDQKQRLYPVMRLGREALA